MVRNIKDIFPSFVFFTTVFPILFVLVFLLFNDFSISENTIIYLSKSLLYSLSYSLMAYILCLLVSIFILFNLQTISGRLISFIVLFFIFQLQLGVIPKLYGYLGAYSVSGFWGLFSNTSIFSYSPFGVSVSLFFIYAPFFFIPFLSSLKNHATFTKSFIIQDIRSIDKVVILLKVYKREFIYASILFFALTIMDFTCSDLIGGGKYDTYGKGLHKTAIYFQDYFSAFVFGVGFLLIIMFGIKKVHYEKH